LHPSQIGKIDLIESSKDVGQSGMISPWADIGSMNTADVNKYPNIKFDLYEFIQHEFGSDLTFNASNIVEYNKILDKLIMVSYINVDYYLKQTEALPK
jgi:hypothetical protein